jgi:predicted RNase H-like HicB family nuclease/predicted RNA binding protein YcfA (HicA-like mRNA interferase family)
VSHLLSNVREGVCQSITGGELALRPTELLKRLQSGAVHNVAFSDFVRLIEAAGFELERTKGSHHIFIHPQINQLMNLQPGPGGDAKPYQIREFLSYFEDYELKMGPKMSDYHINVFWSDEDGCYVAAIPDLHGCSAFGDSPEQAVREVQVAKQLWIEAARSKGIAIPEPTYRAPAALGKRLAKLD